MWKLSVLLAEDWEMLMQIVPYHCLVSTYRGFIPLSWMLDLLRDGSIPLSWIYSEMVPCHCLGSTRRWFHAIVLDLLRDGSVPVSWIYSEMVPYHCLGSTRRWFHAIVLDLLRDGSMPVSRSTVHYIMYLQCWCAEWRQFDAVQLKIWRNYLSLSVVAGSICAVDWK